MFGYSLMAMSSLVCWCGVIRCGRGAQGAGAGGATFTCLCLITGALWGRPYVGTYWVWDARLTSVLVLSCTIWA